MSVPQIRNQRLTPEQMLAVKLPQPKSLAEELVNLELCGYYPDDPEGRALVEAAHTRWHKPALRLTTDADVPDFASRTRTQVRRARELIYEDYEGCVRLPWPSVTSVIGHGFLPHQLWVGAAASGHGKTTACMNVVKDLVEQGKRVYVIPLEAPTDVMRVYLAALKLGFSTRYALANRWRQLPPQAQAAIESELIEQENEGELLHFSDVDFLTLRTLPAVLHEAEAFDADLIVVDHVHQIRSEGRNPHQEFTEICQTLQEFCKNRRRPVLAMAQMHRDKGPKDPLRFYLPPDVDSIQMGKVLEQNSSVVLGFFRPLLATITKQERQRIRLRLAPAKDFLKPNTMAVSVLKSRISGDIGDIVELTYDRGRIVDEQPEQREIYGGN